MRTLRLAFVIPIGLAAALTLEPAHAQGTPGGDGLTALLADCGSLGLAAKGRHEKDKVFHVGHLDVSIADATVTPVVGKSGGVLGLYIDGHGGYTYTVRDAAERESFASNARRVAKALRPVGDTVADTFTQALVLFSSPAFGDVWDESSGGQPTDAPGSAADFTDLVRGALSSYPEFDFRSASARLNGRGRYIYTEFKGGLERVGHVLDEVVDGRERFFNFRKLADYDVRFTETLSFQAVPGWADRQGASITLTHLDLAMATDDNRSGTITSDLTFRVAGAGTRLLSLALLNNLDPDSASWNSKINRLDVKRVAGGDGKDLPFSHKYGELVIEIPPTAGAQADVRVLVETAGEVFLDMNGHHADNYFIFDNTSWFPSPMGWGGERFSYTLKVKAKKPWRPVTSGKETLLREEGDSIVAESRGDHASRHIAILAGKYVTRAETIDGLTVRLHAYAMARKNVLDNLPKLTVALVKFYSGMLGPMPAEELDVVEVPEYGFGVSPSGIVLLTSEAYKPHQDDIAEYLSRGINARLAHEVAHQWFGHKAWQADPSEQWLGESFAEYFSGLALGSLAAQDKTVFGFEKLLAEWRADAKICADVAPIAMANELGGERGSEERRCLLYSRGPLVLHMLRTSIGNDRFFQATKKYLDTADTGPATTNDYAKAVGAVVQMDMRWYFDQWIRGSGVAQVDVEQHVDPAGGQFKLWGVIRQNPGPAFKKLLVPLVWENAGKTEARVVFADQPEKKFEFVLPAKPGIVKPDPFQNNLAVYR